MSTHKLHRCVPHKLLRHTSRTRVRRDTRERRGSRNRPTASPSYHGRRGATRVKTPTASPGTAGQPHTTLGRRHPTLVAGWIATSAKGVQATRATMVTEHTRLTIVTDTGLPPMPLFACRFHLHSFPSEPFGFPRGPFPPPMQLSPRLQRTPPRGRQRRRSHRPGSTGGMQRVSIHLLPR